MPADTKLIVLSKSLDYHGLLLGVWDRNLHSEKSSHFQGLLHLDVRVELSEVKVEVRNKDLFVEAYSSQIYYV
jgi:hypothetical protein